MAIIEQGHLVVLNNLGAQLGVFDGSSKGKGVSCDYYNLGLNLVSLHVTGGVTSKIVKWLVATPLASIGDTSLTYVANDISTSKNIVGTSKNIGVVGETAKLELFNSLTLARDASISLAGNGKKLRHFNGLSTIIVVF